MGSIQVDSRIHSPQSLCLNNSRGWLHSWWTRLKTSSVGFRLWLSFHPRTFKRQLLFISFCHLSCFIMLHYSYKCGFSTMTDSNFSYLNSFLFKFINLLAVVLLLESQSKRERIVVDAEKVKSGVFPASWHRNGNYCALLHNKSHDRELDVSLNGQWLTNDPHPVYLGVTLDRTLSYKHHLTKTAAKLKSRNNLHSKLAGSSWGANAATLRSSALALCYSVGEYCCPVCSSHTDLVDVQLNNTMRLITGSLPQFCTC